MPRRVDEIQLVRFAVARRVRHAHGVELDRNASLTLEVERVEDLFLHLALLHRARGFDQAVGERRLAMIDVRDDAEVADMIELQAGSGLVACTKRRPREARGSESGSS